MDILGNNKKKVVAPVIKVSKEIIKKVEETSDATALANREIDIIRGKKLNLKLNRKFFIKALKRHIYGDRDYILCCSSVEGEGKSTSVAQLGMEFTKSKTKEQQLNFLKNNIIYDPTGGELSKVLKNIKPRSFLIVDEAQKLLYKRNYSTQERKDLIILFSTIREKNLIVIFCIPDFYDLDVYFRNWRIKTWLYIPIRGLNIVFKKSNSPFSKDKWEQKKNQKLIEILEETKNDGKLLSKTGIIKALRKLKSYGFEFGFDDWDYSEVKAQYLQFKEWGGTRPPEEINEVEISKVERNKKIAQEFFKKGVKTNEISEILGLSISSIRDYVRAVRIEIKKKEKEEKKVDVEKASEDNILL